MFSSLFAAAKEKSRAPGSNPGAKKAAAKSVHRGPIIDGKETGKKKRKAAGAAQSMKAPKKRTTKLEGAKFRMLNETLYTCTGGDAFKMFQKDPQLFDAYHKGFASQAVDWPTNPLDVAISYLRKHSKLMEIGDFGCGEARLSATLNGVDGRMSELRTEKDIRSKRREEFSLLGTVHSFDLVARNDSVTACNMADVPLEDGALDVAVFCLALMGVDWPSFVKEAWRCLKPGGVLWVAEVQSRISDSDAFIDAIEKCGFKMSSKEVQPRAYFNIYRFNRLKKRAPEDSHIDPSILTECVYKKR
ncbi:25S rRNA (adenine645-N1)-methyltransferase [Perkinsus olseni]|uniref:Ribosomal RNA-processing protein 8 n=1 Tax=Perkinsus olseni TaxID=32597 RepID=A0A7J6TBG2_PEROL|nr:25S rRNA (adenine645-N1)-methyltransferase [Perkinsus olseni]